MRRVSVLLLLIGVLLHPVVAQEASVEDLFAEIFGGTGAAAAELMIPVYADNQFLGEVSGLVSSQLVQVQQRELLAVLEPRLNDSAREQLLNELSDRSYVDIGEYAPAGIFLLYRPEEVRLEVDLAPELVRERILRDGAVRADLNVQEPVPLSGYLNVVGRGILGNQQEGNLLQAELEPVLNYQGWVLESAIGLVAAVTPPEQPARVRHLRLVRDLPDLRIRAEAGTVRYERASLLAQPEVIGLAATRVDEVGRQESLFRRDAVTFLVPDSGPVEVYLNNRLYRTYRLYPGPHQLEGLPLGRGTNAVELRQPGQDGRAATPLFSEQIYYSPALLRPGRHLYSAALGMQRERDLPEGLFLNLWHRMGVFPNWTVGFSGQASPDQWALAAQSLSATVLGVTRAEGALYLDNTGAVGGAGELSHSVSILPAPRTPVVEGVARIQSAEYRQVLGGFSSGSVLRTALGVNQRVSTTLTASLAVANTLPLTGNFPEETALRFALAYRSPGGPTANLQVGPVLGDGQILWRGSLFIRLAGGDNGIETSVNYDLVQGPATVQVSRPSDTPFRSWSWSAGYQGVDRVPGSAQILDGSVEYSGYRGAVQAQPRYQRVIGAEEAELSLTTQFAGALVWAGGTPVISRPVRNGFVVLEPRSQIAPYPIAVRPGGGAAVAILEGRSAVYPDLPAWGITVVTLDNSYLPEGLSLGDSAVMTFSSAYRSGYRVIVGSAASVYITGRLVDEDDQPFVLEAGEIVDSRGGIMPFFTNREGRFEIAEVAPGEYRLFLYQYPDAQVVFAVPEDELGRYDLEDVVFLRAEE